MAEGPKSKPPQDIVSEIGVDDLYEFLGVSSTSSEKEITTGYRKKALKYHPDKNPDNPNASDLFQRLSKAYHILTDAPAKAAYDKWLRAKFAAKKRHEELNAKRRKLKESLEMRESQGQVLQSTPDEKILAKKMQREIDRLREEGFRKVKEQEEFLRQHFLKQTKAAGPDNSEEDIAPSLKVTWKAKKGDPNNGGYSQACLEDLFSEFGVDHVLVSSKRNGRAVISFKSSSGAQQALGSGRGLKENPLQMVWATGEPPPPSSSRPAATKSFPAATQQEMPSLERDEDYESATLLRLQQAQERKRLKEQNQEDTAS